MSYSLGPNLLFQWMMIACLSWILQVVELTDSDYPRISILHLIGHNRGTTGCRCGTIAIIRTLKEQKNRSLKPVKFYFGRTTAFDRLDLLERRPILGESENG